MNSSRLFGRSAASASSDVRSGVVMRAGSVAIRTVDSQMDRLTTSSQSECRGGAMEVDRRTLVAGGMAALVAAPSLAQRRSVTGSWFDRAIIIDALGGTADPYAPNEWLRWSD